LRTTALARSLTLLFVLPLVWSCDKISFGDKIESGTIEYEITYPKIPKNSYMLDLLPQEMETIFKDGSYRSDIIAGMGLFKTSIICNKDNSHLVHSVKMLNEKKASNLSAEDINDFNPFFNQVEIEFINETKLIAGYECDAAKVKVLGDSSWEFKVYYTNKIDLEEPNKHNPFKEIDGVLLEYEILSYDLHMKFVANKVITGEIESSDLDLEEDYEMVSPNQLKEEIESIFAKVK